MEYFRNIYPHVKEVNNYIDQNDTLIIFDTETEGLEDDHKIIQFSAVLYDIYKNGNYIKLNEKEAYNVYINPERPLEKIITELTGITDEMLSNAYNEKETIPKIVEFMKKSNLWCAYNAKFDLNKLEHTYKRTGYPRLINECFDVYEMVQNIIRKADIKNYKLGTVTEYLCPNYEAQFHNSLEDVRATGKVLEVLMNEYQKIKEPIMPNQTIRVDSVSYWKNPNMGSMRRLTIWSNRKNTGIFWDCKNSCFSCNSKLESKNLFKSINLANVEEQILKKYGPKYQCKTMNELSRAMETQWNEKEKTKKELEQTNSMSSNEINIGEIEFF